MPTPAPAGQKRKAWPLVLLAVVVVGLIAVVVAAAIGNNSVDVPDLAGKTLVQAEQDLAAVELSVGAVTYQPDVPEGTKTGTVVAQSPAAAERMRRHGAVDVTLAGQPEATVPDVVGKEEAQAASALQAAGLQVGDVTRTSSDSVATGLVIEQVPKAGTQVPKNSVVVLTVSSGPAQPTTGTVPNVEGLSEKDATSTLKAAGFAVVSQQAYSDMVESGLVSKQSPPGRQQVRAGRRSHHHGLGGQAAVRAGAGRDRQDRGRRDAGAGPVGIQVQHDQGLQRHRPGRAGHQPDPARWRLRRERSARWCWCSRRDRPRRRR